MNDLVKKDKKGFYKKISNKWLNNFRIKSFFSKFLFIVFIFFLSTFETNSGSSLSSSLNDYQNNKENYIIAIKGKMYNRLLYEVKTYINKIAPDSKLDPEYFTIKCLEYNIDIVFALSQGILESHLGTIGKALETNSIWNVGTYDNGQVLYRYSNPNESVEPYLILLKKNYLINITSNGDTIYKDLYHLLEDRGYINYKGKRFASEMKYENLMRKIIIKIDKETSISFYQKIIQMNEDEIINYFFFDENI